MKHSRLLWLAVAASAATAALAPLARRSRDTHASRPFIYGQEDVTRFLRNNNILVGSVATVRRSARGDELFVFLFKRNASMYEAVRITTNGATLVPSPGPTAFPAPDGQFVAWIPEPGGKVFFRNGRSIRLPRFGLFDVDPSAKFFIIGEEPGRTWIGRTDLPEERHLIAQDVVGSNVFAKGSRIYICGIAHAPDASGRATSAAVCIEVEAAEDAFKVLTRHTFDWADGVRDVDPCSNRVLLWDKRDLLSSTYVFDLTTGRRSRAGWAKGFEFFLRTNLLAWSP